ncbi:MAG: hypothetical protein IJV35_07610 [Neisseriaceae bacterium]|nr:hypothetical protein [Neisseriaceae bacterium]
MKQIHVSKKIFNFIQECFGIPASLYTLIENCPDISMPLNEPKHSISWQDSIIFWQNWHSVDYHKAKGEVNGFNNNNGYYSCVSEVLNELLNFTTCKIIENWQCDIQDVVGLSCSKSTLKDFDTLDKMVETNSQEMITPVTVEKLNQNLAHRGIDIIHNKKTSNHFEQHMWDGRVFLMNHDGSHHFAAARYIANRLNIPVSLNGKLNVYSINEQSVISLCDKYEMVTIKAKYLFRFHEIMRNFRVSYLWYDLPRPYIKDYDESSRVVFFPKNQTQSMKITTILKQSNFFDFGKYLYSLIERQNLNMNL